MLRITTLMIVFAPIAACLALASTSPARADEPRYYVEAIAGLTSLSDDTADVDIREGEGKADLEFDSGFAAGAAFGWEATENVRIEGEYIYKTNGLSKATLPDGSTVGEGDFSSVTLSANGYYLFGDRESTFRPFVGAGIGWLQEVDIDFEEDGEELSWETNDLGWQAMAGLAWRPSETWSFEVEARWFSASDVEMEKGDETVTATYDPITLNVSAAYRF
jgi:opacity protein-like surface antigen